MEEKPQQTAINMLMQTLLPVVEIPTYIKESQQQQASINWNNYYKKTEILRTLWLVNSVAEPMFDVPVNQGSRSMAPLRGTDWRTWSSIDNKCNKQFCLSLAEI